jgi:uncharacterized protein (TIGR02391 family)
MRLSETFLSEEQVSAASAESVGSAIVVHVRDYEEGRIYLSAFYGTAQQMFGNTRRREFMLAISEGLEWAQQNGLIVRDLTQSSVEWYVVSRSGMTFRPDRDLPQLHLERLLPTEVLHPVVREASLDIFKTGRFEAAVFEAFKMLEVSVREAAGYSDRDYGTDMIARAFNAENGPLRDATASDAERQAMTRFMSGAHGVFKIPRSHRSIKIDDPIEAAEMMILASHLMRIVTNARATAERP